MPAKRAPRGASAPSRPRSSQSSAPGKPRSARATPRRAKTAAPVTPEQPGSSETRLQKFLASAGLGSRRQCEELIRTGRITVDGQAVDNPGINIDPELHVIEYDGERLKQERHKYFVLNKPKGVLCTNHDPAGRTRVIDLFAKERIRLFPVGRLDEDSEGLLIVTNDGDLAHQLAHPKYRIYRTYRIQVAGYPTGEKLKELREGMYFREGKFKVISVHRLAKQGKSSFLEVVLGQGHNREVRRLFARIGHKVLSLERVAFGPIRLDKLKSGQYRELTKTELEKLHEIITRNRNTPGIDYETERSEKRERPARAPRKSADAEGSQAEPQKKRIRRPVGEGSLAARPERERKSAGPRSKFRSSETTASAGSRTSSNRTPGNRSSGSRTPEGRPSGGRSTEGRTTGGRSAEGRATGRRSAEGQATGGRSSDQRTSHRGTENRPANKRSSDSSTTGNRTTGNRGSANRSTEGRTSQGRPAEGRTGENRTGSSRKPVKAAKSTGKKSDRSGKSNGPKTYDFNG